MSPIALLKSLKDHFCFPIPVGVSLLDFYFEAVSGAELEQGQCLLNINIGTLVV